MNDNMQIGDRIRRFRESISKTRESFCEPIDLSPRFLADIESGIKGMSANTLKKICQVYPITAEYILFGKEITSQDDPYTPIQNVLAEIPPEYNTAVVDALNALKNTITITTEKYRNDTESS